MIAVATVGTTETLLPVDSVPCVDRGEREVLTVDR